MSYENLFPVPQNDRDRLTSACTDAWQTAGALGRATGMAVNRAARSLQQMAACGVIEQQLTRLGGNGSSVLRYVYRVKQVGDKVRAA